MLRFGLVGAGRIGRLHASNLHQHPATKLTCIHDIRNSAAAEVAAATGARVVDHEREILQSSDVDAVLIASPTGTHANLVERAALAGKAVLCEKPIDLDLARVEQCAAAIERAKVPIQIGFNRRFDPGHRSLCQAVNDGEVGRLEKLIITSRDPSEPTVEYLRDSGGLFRDMMIHDFDLARFIMGEEPVELSALGHAPTGTAAAEVGDMHSAMVIMKSAAGTLCHINCSRRACYGYDQRVEAFGPEGMVISDNRSATGVARFGTDSVSAREPFLHFFVERYRESYVAELTSFVDAVVNNKPPAPSFEDGRRALILAAAAEESMLAGRAAQIIY